MNINITNTASPKQLLVVSIIKDVQLKFEEHLAKYGESVYIQDKYLLRTDEHENAKVLYIIGGEEVILRRILKHLRRNLSKIQLLQIATKEQI